MFIHLYLFYAFPVDSLDCLSNAIAYLTGDTLKYRDKIVLSKILNVKENSLKKAKSWTGLPLRML